MAANNNNKKKNTSSAKKKTASSKQKNTLQQKKGPAPTQPVRKQTKASAENKKVCMPRGTQTFLISKHSFPKVPIS